MSFVARTSFRSTRVATFAPRAFSTSFAVRKTATETVKDGLKTVDRAVADKIVDGIEIGQTAAQKAKQATGISSTEDVKAKASELSGKASGKTSELSGEAKGKANELAGEAKGKKEEIKGKI